MNGPPRLSQQDRADFEHALSQVLARARAREAPQATAAAGVGVERLRILARGSAAEILAAAAVEYQEYALLRAEADTRVPEPGTRPAAEHATGWLGFLALIVPIVTGTAGVIFFLLGAMFELIDSQRSLGDSLKTASLAAGLVAAASALTGVAGLVATAARRRSAQPEPAAEEALARARERWRSALLERGMTPFLLAQAAVGGAEDGGGVRSRHSSPD